jgi:hypothetical protein
MGDPAMATRDDKFRQAAWTYVGYGVVYWLGGLALARSGLGPRGMERGGAAWFIVGALFVGIIPWLLIRTRPWFERWVLSRRDFARVLALLVALRAVEVARIAWRAGAETVPVLGVLVSKSAGAWMFCLITVVTAVTLARAAWSRDA